VRGVSKPSSLLPYPTGGDEVDLEEVVDDMDGLTDGEGQYGRSRAPFGDLLLSISSLLLAAFSIFLAVLSRRSLSERTHAVFMPEAKHLSYLEKKNDNVTTNEMPTSQLFLLI